MEKLANPFANESRDEKSRLSAPLCFLLPTPRFRVASFANLRAGVELGVEQLTGRIRPAFRARYPRGFRFRCICFSVASLANLRAGVELGVVSATGRIHPAFAARHPRGFRFQYRLFQVASVANLRAGFAF